MKFVTSRINTAPVSTEDALKPKETSQRSLDEILESQKQVKTASKSSSDSPKPEEKSAEVEQASKTADAKSELEVAAEIEVLDDEATMESLFGDPKEEKKPPVAAKKDKPQILKVAKKADFRSWNPEEIIKAWNGYGSQEKCVAATQKLTDDPKKYCIFLQAANEEATGLLKAAAKAKKDEPEASEEDPKAEEKVAQPKGVFKKLASLPDKDRSELFGYWTKLYGEEYARAMLDDYVK